jgi:SAM-dependent methyltransferase
MFSMARKQAQQLARQYLAGHCTLIAWWTLRHAGIFDAMLKAQTEKHEGLDPLVYATRANMSPDVLGALLDYLATAGLVVFKKDGLHFTSDGKALYEHEDSMLEIVRAYQPLLEMAEHLLARLKTYTPAGLNGNSASAAAAGGVGGVMRKTEYLVDAQAKRFAEDLYPALVGLVAKHKLTHLLDITCGTGDLLIQAARAHKAVVGVGIGGDGLTARRANAAIAAADLESRLIAVTASPLDVCVETQRTFDRIGVSRQLWKSLKGVLAVALFSEWTGQPQEIARVLSALPRNFPSATLLLAEPVLSPRWERHYAAPEMTLLLGMARALPWPADQWRETLTRAKYKVESEHALNTDGITIFVCQPA